MDLSESWCFPAKESRNKTLSDKASQIPKSDIRPKWYAEDSSKTTLRMQLVENKGRKTGRMIIGYKLVESLRSSHGDYHPVLIME